MTPIDVGSTIGDYQVIGVLGAGGMGKVFKVRNVISDRVEAMKVLLPDLTGEPDLADRFLREIKVLASLSHPNIAGLHTALRFENQLLMLMELVEGVTLEQRLAQGRLSVAEAVDYVGQALAALGYAHQHGVVHRDIKPANMMLTANGVIKLMDFGIAKSAADRRLTMTGTTMGSLYYMSPEQIRGVQMLDARSDLYSVGVSLYELVTGKRPFEGESQFSIMSAHLEKDPVAPIEIDPSLPAALNEIILLSVQREPERRFQTAEAFRNALVTVNAPIVPASAAAPQPAAVDPAPPAVSAPKSRRGLWVAAGALCAVAGIVAVIELGPSHKASADVAAPVSAAPVASPSAPAPEPAPVATAPAPTVTPAQPAPVVTPPVEAPKQAVTRPPAAVPNAKPARSVAQSSPPARQAATPLSAPAQPAQSPPVQQAPVASAPPSTAPAAAVRPNAEILKARTALAQLSARANAIHNTLQGLQRSQAASGLSLRRDWVEAASLMDSFLRGSNDALNAGDLATGQDLMNKAEIQIDKLDSSLR